MPRPAINDYVFYKISCIDEDIDLAYVGSTCNLYKRRESHKASCNNPNHTAYNNKKYKIIRENGGWDNFKLVEIGHREQITKREAEQIEEDYRLELRANMNAIRCYQSKESRIEYIKQKHKEYQEPRKEEKREYDKEYRVKNIETIKAKGKVIITCVCGCEISKGGLSRHLKSKKHLDLMKNNNQ